MRAREAARPALLLALLAVLSGTASAKPELKAFGLQYLGGYVELGLAYVACGATTTGAAAPARPIS